MMKNISIKKISILLLLISTSLQAEYLVKVHLEPDGINMNLPTLITGEATLTPSIINRGETSTISWNYDYANEVQIDGVGTYGKSGSVQVSSLASRNYTINSTYGSLSKTENLYLKVIQPDSNISFTSNKSRIGIGQSVVLNWNVSNSRDIEIDNGIGSIPLIGNTEVFPTTDTTFNLSGFDFSDNSIISSLFIDVVDNSIINSFSASSLNITKGENVTFNWDVTDSEGLKLNPFGSVSGTPTGSQLVSFDTAGFYDFDLSSTSLNGTIINSTPIGINVYNPAVINSYTINSSNSSIDVSPSQSLVFDWTASDSISYKLNGSSISGNSTTLTAASVTGTTPYILTAFNGAGASVTRSLSVNVVGLPVINTFAAPTNVFTNTPLTLSWTGTGVSKYEIKSSDSTSGLETTAFDLGSSTNTNATPTAAGTYTYTLSGYNTANSKIDSTKSVVVESDPIFTGFTVNGSTSISVSPSTSLTFAGSGFSSGSSLNGRNSANTADSTLPTVASTTAGTTTYYATATKTLNSITRNSSARSVSVTVVNAPSIGTVIAPTNVFATAAFTMSWSGTNAVNYKIRGNVAASGITTTDVDLGTATSTPITPTAAGTYTYTITATNAAGVTSATTKSVTVDADPTFNGFTVNSSTSVTVAPNTTLTFFGFGFNSGASLNGRNSANTADATLPTVASTTAGTTTYYATATKTLNSITRNSSARSVSVTVVDAPLIGTVTAPTNVFATAAFTMSWSGTNAVNYKIRGNVAASGITTTDFDLGTATSTPITPTAAGTYTYTITATNAAGVSYATTKSVTVESEPTFTGFTVNGSTSVTVAPSTTLTFAGSGFSSGSSLNGTLPATASTTAGTTTYYATASKTLNLITRNSAARSVSVTVVSNPTIGGVSAPLNVFANAAFTMSWSGTNVTSYSIRGTSSSSGFSTTNTSVGTSTSSSVTPTAAGTYTYIVTATNAAGATATSSITVTVESDPTFTSLTVNGVLAPTSFTLAKWTPITLVSSGLSSGANNLLVVYDSGTWYLQGMNTNASLTAGTYPYLFSVYKTLNGVTRYSAKVGFTITSY